MTGNQQLQESFPQAEQAFLGCVVEAEASLAPGGVKNVTPSVRSVGLGPTVRLGQKSLSFSGPPLHKETRSPRQLDFSSS